MHRFQLYVSLFTLILNVTCAPFKFGFDPNLEVAAILEEGDPERWMGWIAALSGAQPIQTAQGESVIRTRSSFVMFEPDLTPSAFIYLQDELGALGFREGRDYEIHTYAYPYGVRHPERNWKNLILTFPGDEPSLKRERVLLVAHLDSTSDQELVLAPGADDNASGAAGLLEAAARLRHHRFERTIHLIWFSGEEQSRLGSQYFARDYADWLPEITGVINLDMFAFDWDNDRCFEIHAGTLPGSQRLAAFMASAIKNYDLNLKFDLVDDETAYTLSDHHPFWEEGVPGIMVFENFFYHPEGECGRTDRNNHYHAVSDTLTYINQDTGFAILQAVIATLATLAVPAGPCFNTDLQAISYSDIDTVYGGGGVRIGACWKKRLLTGGLKP